MYLKPKTGKNPIKRQTITAEVEIVFLFNQIFTQLIKAIVYIIYSKMF